jgi:hypothetical protein
VAELNAHGAGPENVERFVWERALRASGLPFGTRGVLAILGAYMDRDGTGARPSLDTLATACGLGRRQVSNHLRPALDGGWLVRESGRGPGSATSYQARLPTTEIGKPVARTARSRAGNQLPDCGQSTSRVGAADCPPPTQDQIKTTNPHARREYTEVRTALLALRMGEREIDEVIKYAHEDRDTRSLRRLLVAGPYLTQARCAVREGRTEQQRERRRRELEAELERLRADPAAAPIAAELAASYPENPWGLVAAVRHAIAERAAGDAR